MSHHHHHDYIPGHVAEDDGCSVCADAERRAKLDVWPAPYSSVYDFDRPCECTAGAIRFSVGGTTEEQ